MSRSRWTGRLLAIFLLGLPVPSLAQNSTSGNCSPIVAGSTANDIAVTLNCSFGGGSFDVELIRATLACNNAVEAGDKASGQLWRGERVSSANDLFKQLERDDDKFVYLDLFIWVGYGCGFDESVDYNPRFGVVYKPDFDGFSGNPDAYKYGYTIEFDHYVEELGNNRMSTILFPKDDNAFFTARYGKAFFLDGLAKIKLSAVQGFQFIEITPATPIGGLADYYSKFKRYLKETYPTR